MAKLIYGMGPTTLDGYVSARDGSFNWPWTPADDDLHMHAGAELDGAGTAIYGRNMYLLMAYWETVEVTPETPPADVAFTRSWQAIDKIVISRTLAEPQSARTRIVPSLDVEEMRALKAAATRPLTIAGPTAASPFLNAGLVDEISAYFVPLVAGGGLPMFKDVAGFLRLEQIEERAFKGGYTFRRFAVRNNP